MEKYKKQLTKLMNPILKKPKTDSINVLHIHNVVGIGGAFIAADRLHQALMQLGVESAIGYRYLESHEPKQYQNLGEYICIYRKQRPFERLVTQFSIKLGLDDVTSVSSFSLRNEAFFHRASLLHLHNLQGEYFSYLALPALTKEKPAIWTLHDMWSFTGHCAYSYDCLRWQTGCGKCPYPDVLPPIERDATALQWTMKNWAYSRSNLTIVTPSLWMKKQVEQSMLKHLPIYHIPHGIDTEVYQPLDGKNCRSQLDIPLDKKVLIFGSQTLTNPRKGSNLLLKALACLPKSLKAEIVLVVFGDSGVKISETVEIATRYLGYVSSDRLKAIAYSAADLFLFPSRADNFPLVLLESMACGTPIVSFNVGGVSDLVRSGITGYLATPENPDDFCNGIIQLLEDEYLRTCLSQNCRAIALKEYPLELQAQRYVNLYQQTINSNRYCDNLS